MIADASGRQLPLPFTPAPAPLNGPFFPADSNQQALAWLEQPRSWPDGRLLLWGPRGVGKTHLLHRWAEANGTGVLAGAALNWPVEAGDAVAVDDAEAAPEVMLLHLLNDAAQRGWRVLLAARSPAAAWPTRLPDLASRLRATPAVAIEPAEDDLLRAVLRRVLADRHLVVPETLQEWLLRQLPRSPAALAEAAARLEHARLAGSGRVTRAQAGAVVDEMAPMWHADAS